MPRGRVTMTTVLRTIAGQAFASRQSTFRLGQSLPMMWEVNSASPRATLARSPGIWYAQMFIKNMFCQPSTVQ